MALCSACQNISISNLIRELDDVPSWWETIGRQSEPRGMVHLLDARQLPTSASGGCVLCALIRDAILQYDRNRHTAPNSTHPPVGVEQQNHRDIEDFEKHLIDSPIYLRPNYDPRKPAFPEEDVANAWHVRGFKAFVPVDHGILTGQIRLFALRGTASCLDLTSPCY